MRRVFSLAVMQVALLCAAVARAEVSVAGAPPPGGGFSLPIDCAPGIDCWVMNYPDAAPGKEFADFTCGLRSYDGHKGTDFAIRDVRAMQRGVDVLAAAGGIVRRARDRMIDRRMRTDADVAALRGRECGNGLVVDHGGGWETQYCHLRRGSLVVRAGDRVKRGQPLGRVGLSGQTEFPHVHLSVRHGGEVLDPATGQRLEAGCGGGATPLWRAPEKHLYQPMALYAVGFADRAVQEEKILQNADSPERLPVTAPALVLWATAFGVRKGDVLTLHIAAPDGGVLYQGTVDMGKDQAWRLDFAGKKRTQVRWPAGLYRGEAVLRRGKNDTAVTLRKRISVSVQ